MVIIDEKDGIKTEIETLTKHRRFHPTKAKRVKWISEFSYPIDSEKNPMVQLSDLVCFASKKYLGIEAGYHDNYPKAAKDFFRELYLIIDERLIKKGIVPEEGRYAADFNNFMRQITPKPSPGRRRTDLCSADRTGRRSAGANHLKVRLWHAVGDHRTAARRPGPR